MSKKITFTAQPRTVFGKKVKHLAAQGHIPANISGNTDKSVGVTVPKKEFEKLYHQVGDTGLFYLTVQGEQEERPVLVNEVQHDPISNMIQHVAFRQVNLTQKVTAEVPVETVGEFTVKNAVLVKVQNTIEVSALPQDLPEKFEVDLSQLKEIGDSITYETLKFDRDKVTLSIAAEEMNTPLVLAQEIKEEVVEETPVVAAEGAAATDAAGATATADAAAKPAAGAKPAAPTKAAEAKK